MRVNDTIVAIATAIGESGIGIVRVSGEDAIDIVDKVYKGKYKLVDKDSHTIHYGHIVSNGEVIDEVLVMLMRAPRTYTGEDTVEINCHGGSLVVAEVLHAVLDAGANLAEPGEFTKRAFLNGKMDLSEAEAVIDVIEAKNGYALKAGIQQLHGSIKISIEKLRASILEQIAFIEAALDDPEHYSLKGYPKKLEKIVIGDIKNIDTLLKSYQDGITLKEGIDITIIGRPNAGKSSLLNLLAGKERAIVTDIAGTTRDTITEHIRMSDISLNITDTAGIRESEDVVEKIGIDKAKKALYDANLVIYVIDGLEQQIEEDNILLSSIEDKKVIVLLNKSDGDMKVSLEDIKRLTSKKVILFSAKDGTGLLELEETIKKMFYSKEIDFNDQIYITNIRHIHLLEKAKNSLEMVLASIDEGLEEDFFSIDLLNAYEILGEIIGETIDDDVINEIFAKFCMGK